MGTVYVNTGSAISTTIEVGLENTPIAVEQVSGNPVSIDINAGGSAAVAAVQIAASITEAEGLVATTEANALAAATSESNAHNSEVAAAASETQTGLDLVATNQDTIDTAADVVSTNADAVATAADRVQTGLDAADTAQDALDTAADVVLTHADVVLTNADAAQTALDVIATNQDALDTAADVVSTNADATQTNLDAIATAADRVQTGLDIVATGDDVIATNADVVLTHADVTTTLGYKNDAETAASNAATSESNASDSEDAAVAAHAAVEIIFDNFDDRFLGSKIEDPTVDNDGDALLTGAFYYNSVAESLRFYNGVTWEDPVASAAASATASFNSADAASTSESNASDSAAAALTSEQNAATSETNAGTSETNAGNAQVAAETAQGLAEDAQGFAETAQGLSEDARDASVIAQGLSEDAQTAAETAQGLAEAAWDSLDNRYLGPHASDPSVDNDGQALVVGALYFNSAVDEMRVYDGAIWTAAYVPSGISASDITFENLDANSDVGTTANTLAEGDHLHTGVYAPVLGADDNYVTDAEKVILSNTSNTNTGDQVIPQSGVDFDPVGTDNSDDNAVNTNYADDYRAANFVAGTNYLAPDGDGSALTGIAAGVALSDTAPASPSAGDLWWDSETGDLYVRYDDGDTSQWVSMHTTGLDGTLIETVTSNKVDTTTTVTITGTFDGAQEIFTIEDGYTPQKGVDYFDGVDGDVTTGKAIAMSIVFG